jgi:hypothetical protein
MTTSPTVVEEPVSNRVNVAPVIRTGVTAKEVVARLDLAAGGRTRGRRRRGSGLCRRGPSQRTPGPRRPTSRRARSTIGILCVGSHLLGRGSGCATPHRSRAARTLSGPPHAVRPASAMVPRYVPGQSSPGTHAGIKGRRFHETCVGGPAAARSSQAPPRGAAHGWHRRRRMTLHKLPGPLISPIATRRARARRGWIPAPYRKGSNARDPGRAIRSLFRRFHPDPFLMETKLEEECPYRVHNSPIEWNVQHHVMIS